MQPERELEDKKKLLREMANIAGLQVVDPANSDKWPTLAPEAEIGIAGDFVRLVEPQTEADPVALLTTFLVISGVLFGRGAWAVADGKTHYPTEFLVTVGGSGAAGRKGTALGRVLPVARNVDQNFERHRELGGLSSGEGLIKRLAEWDPGIPRCFVATLPEFGSLLQTMKREGNTLSPVLRQAWDGDRLQVLTRKDPLEADSVNLSIVAHVTPDELLNGLTATDRANGFANRFLIPLVKRSKELPEGGELVNFSSIVGRLNDAVELAHRRGPIQRDKSAKCLWAAEYSKLTRPRPGLMGALCARAEAHALRLSLIYALLDGASEIRVDHVEAAIALWNYCEASIENIFGGARGDLDADKILAALANGPRSMIDLFRLFGNNRRGEWIQAKMAALVGSGKVITTTIKGHRKDAVPAWALKGKA